MERNRFLSRQHMEDTMAHEACVRRRAILSVKQNPSCQGEGVAEDAVRAVWDSCFKDTAPYDEIP
ncbi:Mitochondrial inner membrane protease atp23 [Blyttiomyces sp. JEL0837]|nr:Mitochondrial inner membrane protease atp23 [Blyttiomyces sp. JEL0837]